MKGILNEMAGMVAFVRTVETGSFSAAAKSLGLTPSAASKSVSRLELLLGAKLFRRSTRTLSLTHEGDAFYGLVMPLMRQIESATEVVRPKHQASGHLRVGLPGDLGIQILKPVFTEFMSEHPAISFEISTTDRHVDILREKFDVVFRVGEVQQNALISRTIAHLDMALVASPIFVAQWGLVEDVRRLQKLPFARYTMAGRHYPIRFVNGTEIVPEGRVDLDSASAIREAVISGVGAGHLVRRLVQEDIDQGRIIELLPSMKLQTVPLQAIHVSGNMPPHRLTLLVNFVAGAMRRA
ncbi:LysR family transcriptional regulator [Sinorhizobium medicae]|uniref:LysR family transcriptional regulator n=3 Tax=Sinorhizobium medicae TaxID=110321 RepID=UPI000FE137F4|nr:LysR family transcriptional regulator [Sinorhizobium medicae]MBO1944802.1 LysR family transcriptional regulator [Sinorhizobium medicae]MDX0488015.1 LysR family transcriptional regulator [Sinorhizobium medicae]MDX0493615.1 LysR family transcriptional regulator [Sinorhizobium medicae]MDX0530966.1 LysR family transcriptional regulator [Sinorhizobium medicae]MDX0543784.1 LysR family transcriptional regulator [Sinorhizobium medicae]